MDMSDLHAILATQNPVKDYLLRAYLQSVAQDSQFSPYTSGVYDTTAMQRRSLQDRMTEPGGGKGGQGPSPGTYGTMTQDERNTIEGISRTLGALSSVPGPQSIGMLAGSKMASGINTIDDMVNALGLGSRGYSGLSPQDIQSFQDTYGFNSAREASERTASAIGRSTIDQYGFNDERNSLLGSLFGRTPDPTFAQEEASRMDIENSLADLGFGSYGMQSTPAGVPSDWGEPGAFGGWGGPDSDPGGIGHSAGDTGQAGYAKGGVGMFNQPTQVTAGEAGPEMGIFIKPEMFQPGNQGNEQQVKLALFMAAMGLGGRLPVDKESEFQKWYKQKSGELGINPNPDDPNHQYDYRGAFLSGDDPSWQPEHQQFRWTDRYKRSGHPNMDNRR